MSRRLRNSLYVGLIVGLLAVVIVGLIPRNPTPETPAERSLRIADSLRCPFCNGESIADAQSSIAADLRDLIDEQIASGMTDVEIFDYYVNTYTTRVLLSPPLLGWGLVLWALPLLLLIVGVFAFSRRRRSGNAPPSRMATADHLAEARRVVGDDLAELDVQEAAGEIDRVAASRLRAAYEEERDSLAGTSVAPPPAGRSPQRVAAGIAILVVGGLALAVAVVLTVRDRAPGNTITGGVANAAEARPLSEITNEEMEAVVAQNPGVVRMRLALAGRYFNEGNFSAALEHYLIVLEEEQNPEALANLGWMTYLSGDVDTGLALVERSLGVTIELPQAHWYLANIRYWGLSDAAGAVGPLEALLAFESIPDEVRDEASQLLGDVKAAS